jgi:WXG100 family type VII secretion target
VTGKFRIDRAQLLDVIDRMRRFDAQVEEALQDAEARVNRLHATWSGQAAAAHDKWTHGMQQMRAGLQVMRVNAQIAHDNYTGAVEANVSMWKQVL